MILVLGWTDGVGNSHEQIYADLNIRPAGSAVPASLTGATKIEKAANRVAAHPG